MNDESKIHHLSFIIHQWFACTYAQPSNGKIRNEIQNGFQKPQPFLIPRNPMPIDTTVIAAAIHNVKSSMTIQ
jgi:hypothetical protein